MAAPPSTRFRTVEGGSGRPRPRPDSARASSGATIALSLKVLLALALGTALGLGATALVVERRIDPAAVRVGPWVLWPKAGTTAIDPYARAVFARSGQVPVAAAEGLLFLATADRTGAALSGRCSYRITGRTVAARLWSLSVTIGDGRIPDTAIGRAGFTSAEVLRSSEGGFVIEAAATARAGNWLPVPVGSFGLALHLYETPLESAAAELDKGGLPSIEPEGCDE